VTTLTIAAALTLAAACQSAVAPATIVGMARHESGLDPAAIHHNADGSTDYGLMQINSGNLALLGLTPATALDPCRSIAAGARLLVSFSRYNTGSPTRGIANGYAVAVVAAAHAVRWPSPSRRTIDDTPTDEPEAELTFNGG
jgi:type IV secretion system protein VirB1